MTSKNIHGHNKRLFTIGKYSLLEDNILHYVTPEGERKILNRHDMETIRDEEKKMSALSHGESYVLLCRDLEEGEFGRNHDEEMDDGVFRAEFEMTFLSLVSVGAVVSREITDAIHEFVSKGKEVKLMTSQPEEQIIPLARELNLLNESCHLLSA